MLSRTSLAVALVALGACQTAASREQVDLIVANGTVIDPSLGDSGIVADIAIDEGLIIAVGDGLQDRYDAKQIIDARGEYIIPGLADMHTHFGTGVRAEDEDDTTPVLARLLYYGVTTTLNLGSFQAWPARIDSLRAAIADGTLQGPRLLAVGALITVPGSHPTTTIYSPAQQARIAEAVRNAPAEGPIDLKHAALRATTLVRTDQDMRQEVRRVGDWGADAIKLVVESGPDPFGDDHPQLSAELIRAAVDAARPHDIPVLCHVSSADELVACLDNGGGGVVHGVTGDLPDGIEERMAAAGMVLIPTASLFEGWARYPSDPSLLDDPFLATTISTAERDWLTSDAMSGAFPPAAAMVGELAHLRAHILAAHRAGVLIVAGTDVGNPYRFAGHSLHEELTFYVSAGMTPAEALATATTNAAKMVGDESVWGSIQEGLAADLVVLGANPLDNIANTRQIRGVIKGGRVIDREALPVR